MSAISETNLILNPDGSVYHLGLVAENVSNTIIAVGDPGRVEKVTRHFDTIDFKASHREFITHTGHVGKKRVTVISTGIGTDNVEIVFNELDALFNIDLHTREIRKEKNAITLIRIGTSGSLREDVPLDTHVISDFAIGLDNLMSFYDLTMTSEELQFAKDVQVAAGLTFQPIVVRGDAGLREMIGGGMLKGNTATCPGFYAPQGRTLRIPIRFPSLMRDLGNAKTAIANFEMETSGYFSLGRLLGHRVASVSAILANRATQQFSRNPEKTIDSLIRSVLERL